MLCVCAERPQGFHCIVLDPPWENKSAKRGSKYPTLPSRNLKGIPLQKLMHAVSFWQPEIYSSDGPAPRGCLEV